LTSIKRVNLSEGIDFDGDTTSYSLFVEDKVEATFESQDEKTGLAVYNFENENGHHTAILYDVGEDKRMWVEDNAIGDELAVMAAIMLNDGEIQDAINDNVRKIHELNLMSEKAHRDYDIHKAKLMQLEEDEAKQKGSERRKNDDGILSTLARKLGIK